MTILWNEVTIWWNEVTKGWNEVVWNEVVMERSDRIPLEITVGHRTLSDQISKLSDQFYNMVGHDVRAPK